MTLRRPSSPRLLLAALLCLVAAVAPRSAAAFAVDPPPPAFDSIGSYAQGHFLTTDPVNSASPGNPHTWNKYGFVRGNPLSFIDPDGGKEQPVTDEDRSHYQLIPGTDTPKDHSDPYSPANHNATNCFSCALHNGRGDPTDPANWEIVPFAPNWDQRASDDLSSEKYRTLRPDEPNKPGDLVFYYRDDNADGKFDENENTHVAIVTKVDKDGNTILVRSKFNDGPEADHHPADDRQGYGPTRVYVRPLGPKEK